MTDTAQLVRILDIMRALRDPETGCPWDIEQTFASIVPYTIEEAEEIGEAIKAALINQAKLPDRDTFMKKEK